MVVEIHKHFGDGTTKDGLRQYFVRNILPNARSLKEAVTNGEDLTRTFMFQNVRDGKPGDGQLHISFFCTYIFRLSSKNLKAIFLMVFQKLPSAMANQLERIDHAYFPMKHQA
jgi:hypothetical protein